MVDPNTLRWAPRSGGRASALIILLHGVGSAPDAMAPIADALARTLPRAAFAALEGSEPFDLGHAGRQWFSVSGVTETNRAARIQSAMPLLHSAIQSEAARVDLSISRIALVGFSQGAIMALHGAASVTPAPLAVVSFAGRIAQPLGDFQADRPTILLSHGEKDAVIPLAENARAAAALRGIGCAVDVQVVPHWGHGVHAAQISRAQAFLAAAFAPFEGLLCPE